MSGSIVALVMAFVAAIPLTVGVVADVFTGNK